MYSVPMPAMPKQSFELAFFPLKAARLRFLVVTVDLVSIVPSEMPAVDEPSLPRAAILNPDMEPAILFTSIMEKGSYPIQ